MHAFDPDWQAVRRAVPARLRVDARAGACPLRLRGAAQLAPVTDREALLAGTRETLVARCARDDGRRPRRRLPVGRARLVACRRDRIAYRHERGERLLTFAVGTEGSPDLAAARMSPSTSTPSTSSTYTAAEAIESLPTVVRSIESFDPGLVRSAVPNFMLARFTSEHVKVVLTGEGADELFAGYDYMRDFTEDAALHDELVRTVRSLHNLNLQRCDRVTMAHALEARVPFLDREVIEWALRSRRPTSRPASRRRSCCATRSTAGCRTTCCGATRPSSVTAAGLATCSAAIEETVSDEEFEAERGRGRAAAAHQGGARLLPRSSATTSTASAPSARSAASPAPRPRARR